MAAIPSLLPGYLNQLQLEREIVTRLFD